MRYPGLEATTARQLRLSPLYQRLKDHGAVYGSKNGWERPLWFAPEGVDPVDQLAFVDPGWKTYAAQEHAAVRTGVVLIDQSSFSKFELIGQGALVALQHLAVSNMDKPLGSVIYTQLCNTRGGIKADVTIIRLARDRFYIVTGSGFGVHDSDWIRRSLPKERDVHLIDVTSGVAVINICGPKARDVLARVSENDLFDAAFPFATAQQIIIGAATVQAVHIGYVGELGWELHIPTEFAAHFGASPSAAQVGRMVIYKTMCDLLWTLWGLIQHADDNPAEDFWAYAVGRFDRCKALMADPQFERHMAAVRG